MLLQPKSSLTFKKLIPEKKVGFGNKVIGGLSPEQLKKAKANGSELPVPVADLQALNDRLNTAIASAGTGNHVAISKVKAIAKEWSSKFGLTADYITSVARGTENPVGVIRAAGFVPTKTESTPTVEPGPLDNFYTTINGTKGAIIAGGKKATPGAVANVFVAFPDGVTVSFSNNTMILTTESKTIFINVDTQKQTKMYGLNSAQQYNVCAYGVNRKGHGPVSPTMEIVPQ